jgi:signal transduction histidine kinase
VEIVKSGEEKGGSRMLDNATTEIGADNHLKETSGALKKRVQGLAPQLLKIQERERQRISRDLHDDLGQSLISLKFRLISMQKKLGMNFSEASEEFAECLHSVDEAIEKVRRISYDLRPPELKVLGLKMALTSLIKDLQICTNLKVSINIDDRVLERFSSESQIVIYRIFQECLNNIMKHSQATQVKINIQKKGESASLSCDDNGKGFDFKIIEARKGTAQGFGLASMYERTRMLRGLFRMRSKVGKGTKIEIVIPFEK